MNSQVTVQMHAKSTNPQPHFFLKVRIQGELFNWKAISRENSLDSFSSAMTLK